MTNKTEELKKEISRIMEEPLDSYNTAKKKDNHVRLNMCIAELKGRQEREDEILRLIDDTGVTRFRSIRTGLALTSFKKKLKQKIKEL